MNPSLARWAEANAPAPSNFFCDAALEQFEHFVTLGQRIGRSPVVVSTHRSKSLTLPVVLYRGAVNIFLRDNFHDVNLCAVSAEPFSYTFAEVYGEPLPPSWYWKEMNRCADYTWKGWTEDQIRDPNVRSVQVRHDAGHFYESKASTEKKERWLRRLKDQSWYEQDWSGGRLFRDDRGFYHAPQAFREGMSAGSPEAYEPGCTSFTVAVTWEEAERLAVLLSGGGT